MKQDEKSAEEIEQEKRLKKKKKKRKQQEESSKYNGTGLYPDFTNMSDPVTLAILGG